MTTVLTVQDITCHYGEEKVVRDVSFELESGALACLLGPSGCGKTTVLRAIAGFQPLLFGKIELHGRCISSPAVMIAPEKRNLGMVFQDNALFPHLTVEKNIAAGLHARKPSEIRDAVGRMLHYVRLERYSGRYPHELSAGQQQRVALARALAPNPRLLLMDEPFSNLDVELRERLGQETRDLLKETGTTCIMVTHDQQDAFTFSDVVGVMRDGNICQWDTPYNLYHEPATEFVANFVGDGTFLDAEITSSDRIKTDIATHRGTIRNPEDIGKSVKLLIRPDDVVIDGDSEIPARIVRRTFRGENYLYTLALAGGQTLLSLMPSHQNHEVGEDIRIRLEIEHLVYFRAT
ncbi:MAG: ABC transporter ATP-binding protein [Gammaproteobacteria bacterium]|nr:ABC transporter ATP-binding protein [Gammaproteobacteria bacterium]MYD76547.1 ABC transporter ATP-binding protein [Gammaproteobacteria bacterium]